MTSIFINYDNKRHFVYAEDFDANRFPYTNLNRSGVNIGSFNIASFRESQNAVNAAGLINRKITVLNAINKCLFILPLIIIVVSGLLSCLFSPFFLLLLLLGVGTFYRANIEDELIVEESRKKLVEEYPKIKQGIESDIVNTINLIKSNQTSQSNVQAQENYEKELLICSNFLRERYPSLFV